MRGSEVGGWGWGWGWGCNIITLLHITQNIYVKKQYKNAYKSENFPMVSYIRYLGYLFKSDYKLHLVTKYMILDPKLTYIVIFSGTYYYPNSRDKILRGQKIKIFNSHYDIKFYHKI